MKNVIDGETFLTTDGEEVRLLWFNGRKRGDLKFHQDKRALEQILPIGSLVTIYPTARDVYGRLVADVRNGHGDVAEQMKRRRNKI